MRYALKIKANIDNPTYDSLFNLMYSDLYLTQKVMPLGESIDGFFHEVGIVSHMITPSILPEIPVWQ